jgi:23S rRNA (uridine2552-2'-O)-methyltransferase
MSNRWIHERKSEFYHLKAQEEGYRSRASYKLKQIQNRFRIFDGARYVLDLGAAPGGWLQVAAESLDDEGLVVGVDLNPIEPLPNPNVMSIVGDVTEAEVQEEIMNIFHDKVDVVLSDMAPDVIGQWDVDQYRQIHLARVALSLAEKLLSREGWFVVKIFQGGEHVKFVREVREAFEVVKNYKPRASRKQSAERYVVAHILKQSRKYPKPSTDKLKPLEEDEGPIPGDQLFFEPE